MANSRRTAAFLAVSAAAFAMPDASARDAAPAPAASRLTQQGMASWHVPGSAREARHTASERVWKNDEFVAAHRTLPLGAKARVVNLSNGNAVVVEITDRGPYKRGRIIDLSLVAAIRLGMVTHGTALVRVEEIVKTGHASVRVTATPPRHWPAG